jgi:hypothetical protein
VRELRGFTARTELSLNGCTKLTDAGLQHLTSLTALTKLYIRGTSTTQAGRNALKTALPALTVLMGLSIEPLHAPPPSTPAVKYHP